MRQKPGSPAGLSALALQRPPVLDQFLPIGGVIKRPEFFRNSLFQPLDGARSLDCVVLAAKAIHLDATIVWHHLLEAQMSKRGEMQQFADRKIDADSVCFGCHLPLARVVSLAPASGADGIAEDPKPRMVSKKALFGAYAAPECL